MASCPGPSPTGSPEGPCLLWVLTSSLSSPGQFLFERVEGIARATIVDLDAHQVSALWGLGSHGCPSSGPLCMLPINTSHAALHCGTPTTLGTALSPKADFCHLHPDPSRILCLEREAGSRGSFFLLCNPLSPARVAGPLQCSYQT